MTSFFEGQAVFEALGLVDIQQHFDHLLEISSLLIEGISDVPSYSSRVRKIAWKTRENIFD